ncbi:MAG: GLPGLI family protein [Chitinophagaceae bacterium]|nr:MAG: GLPGLI family protein [Chitinophagaceae bacterium]
MTYAHSVIFSLLLLVSVAFNRNAVPIPGEGDGLVPRPTYRHVAIYNLHYQRDSTNSKFEDATMALLAGGEYSIFGALGNLNADTIRHYRALRKQNNWQFRSKPEQNHYFDYRVVKYADEIATFDRIAVAQSPIFKYSEPKTVFKWLILNDTSTIAGYKCQKASCHFGNRTWISWFSTEIPISDGPYKFCGLPGLIIQISDTQNYWNFTLVSFENKEYFFPDTIINGFEVENTTKNKFMTLLRSSYQNGFEMEQQYGLVFNNMIEETQERYRARAKSENNWLERFVTAK